MNYSETRCQDDPLVDNWDKIEGLSPKQSKGDHCGQMPLGIEESVEKQETIYEQQ